MSIQLMIMDLSLEKAWEEDDNGLMVRNFDSANFILLQDIKDKINSNTDLLKELDLESVSKLLSHVLSFEYVDTINTVKNIFQFAIELNPLQAALLQGDFELSESLLKNGEKPEGPEWYVDSLVCCIFWKENISIVRNLLILFLKYGLDIGFRNSCGENMLSLFISYFVGKDDLHAVEIAKILIESGIEVNENSKSGETSVYFSISCGNVPLVSLLIEKGGDVRNRLEPSYEISQYPLIVAASWDDKDLLDLLLSNGSNVNSKMIDGWTALHEACKSNNIQSIRYLIEKGADVNAACTFIETPLKNLDLGHTNYEECMKIIVKEFSKLFFVDPTISKTNMDFIRASEKELKYFNLCINELKKMTKTKFYAPFSYHFIFKTSRNKALKKKLAQLTKNDTVITNFKSRLNEFFYYKDDLERIFNEAIRSRDESLIVESRLKAVFGEIFPDIVIRKLSDNL